jgi:SMC interacting uncharacterized protein involved in chromosome segregation
MSERLTPEEKRGTILSLREQIAELQALLEQAEVALEAEVEQLTKEREHWKRMLREGIRNIRDFEQSFVNKDGAHTATVRLLDGLLVDEESEAEA